MSVIATAVSHYPKLGDGPGQQKLRQAISRADRGHGEPGEVDLAAAEMTIAAIREQEKAGLDLVTDGQIRWQDPVTYIARGLLGFEITGLRRWFESNTYYRQPLATGPIRWRGPILAGDLRFAMENATKPVKAVVTGPYTIGTLSAGGHRDLVMQVALALNWELRSLAEAEPAWIQIDEPAISNNPSVGYPRDLGLFAEAMHALVEGVPGELSLYVYHGDAAGIPGLLDLPFRLIGLDFVQGSANWGLLDGWPRERALGLGIVDARNVRMETAEQLAGAIRRAEAALPAAIHVSPSCGLEFLPRDTAYRKLQLVARAAHSEQGVPA